MIRIIIVIIIVIRIMMMMMISELIQKTAALGTARILRKPQASCSSLLSERI